MRIVSWCHFTHFQCEKNPLGEIFSILYGMITYSYAYYGEIITYLGMTMAMAGLLLFLGSISHF